MGRDRSCETLGNQVSLGLVTWLTYAGLEVVVQLVATVTAADRPIGGVLAVVGTASVGRLAAVDDLHLDACGRDVHSVH